MKVCSGAQTGVDQAALAVAHDLEWETGGYIPTGALTLDGPRHDLVKKYGLTEFGVGYKPRTGKNVETANFTLRIFSAKNSPGEICTLNWINIHKKPYYDIDLNTYRTYNYFRKKSLIHAVVARLYWYCQKDGVLNVAGNSEKTSPGIYQEAYDILNEVFLTYATETN